MDFLVLGPLRILTEGHPTEIGAAIPRMLLGVLLVHANQVVSADRLLEEVWGDQQPAAAVKTLRYHVSKLRDWLDPNRAHGTEGAISTVAKGYVLRVAADEIDAGRFERLADEGGRLLEEGHARPARGLLAEALELWRGGAFEDFRYARFAQGEIARLEEQRLLCTENRITADLELGRHREVVGELRELTTQFPMREGLWGLLMVALYRSDQQAEALNAYQDARRVLGEELGIEPNEGLQRLEEQILLQRLPFELPPADKPPAGNLPARTSTFVGRVDEGATVEKLVKERRLVTLTGLGGIGKTTLAIEVSRRVTDNYSGGVWLITLAALSDPRDVIAEIARTFEVAEQPGRALAETVIHHLTSKSVLLVLDNCEHLIPEVAHIANNLLEGCPGLSILATSREPLHIPGEQAWAVPPLDVPDSEEEITIAEAGDTDAVRLFVERARESVPTFELDDSNFGTVVAVCRRLDGIPLALEMAAARLRLLSPRQLLDRLDDRFGLLTDGARTSPERQQTLRATLDWSYDLLSDREQELLARLAVFDDGFTLEAVEAVCAGDGINPADVVDLMGRLIDASLVRVGARESVRYGMLETVRQYAQELLAASPVRPTLQNRHARYYLRLLSQDLQFDSAEFGAMLDAHFAERGNLRVALNGALDVGDVETGLRLAAALGQQSFFHTQMMNEGLDILTRALAAGEPTPSRERAEALVWFCMLNRSDNQQTRNQTADAANEIAHIGEVLGDELIGARSLWIRHFMAEYAGDYATSYQLVRDRAVILERFQDPLLALTLHSMAALSVKVGELDRANRLAAQVERSAAAHEQPQMLAHAAEMRGTIAYHRGDLYEAERLLSSAIGELRRLRRINPMHEALLELAGVTLAAGKPKSARIWTSEYLELATRMEDGICLAWGHGMAGRIALHDADPAGACREARTALNWVVASDMPGRSIDLAAVCAQILLALGHPEPAAVLFAGAERIRRELGVHLPISRTRELDRSSAEARALLDPNAFRVASERGTAMSENDLIRYAQTVVPRGEAQQI